jgi:hypothetical protein
MAILKPRNRLVNFRLSDEELENLRLACAAQGARSLSDFARAAVLRAVETSPAEQAQAQSQIAALDQKVQALQLQVITLAENVRRSHPAPAPVRPTGHALADGTASHFAVAVDESPAV